MFIVSVRKRTESGGGRGQQEVRPLVQTLISGEGGVGSQDSVFSVGASSGVSNLESQVRQIKNLVSAVNSRLDSVIS